MSRPLLPRQMDIELEFARSALNPVTNDRCSSFSTTSSWQIHLHLPSRLPINRPGRQAVFEMSLTRRLQKRKSRPSLACTHDWLQYHALRGWANDIHSLISTLLCCFLVFCLLSRVVQSIRVLQTQSSRHTHPLSWLAPLKPSNIRVAARLASHTMINPAIASFHRSDHS
jgi:hypothetical protein